MSAAPAHQPPTSARWAGAARTAANATLLACFYATVLTVRAASTLTTPRQWRHR